MRRMVVVLSLCVLYPALLIGSAFFSDAGVRYAGVGAGQLGEWLFGKETRETNVQFLEVSDVTSSSAVISWLSEVPVEGVVEYGPTKGLGQEAADRVEGFFGFLTRERVNRRNYRTMDEARAGEFDCIKVLYDNKRRHSHLGDASPWVFSKPGQGQFSLPTEEVLNEDTRTLCGFNPAFSS